MGKVEEINIEDIKYIHSSELNKLVHECLHGKYNGKGSFNFTKNLDKVLELERAIWQKHLESQYVDNVIDMLKTNGVNPINMFSIMHCSADVRSRAFCMTMLKKEREEYETINSGPSQPDYY